MFGAGPRIEPSGSSASVPAPPELYRELNFRNLCIAHEAARPVLMF